MGPIPTRGALILGAILACGFPAGAQTDPAEAAQRGIDWLMPALCEWTDPESSQIVNCAEGTTVSGCFGCHVQAESVLGLARSRDRCYALTPSRCTEPGDGDPLEYLARFLSRVQRKDCILGRFNCFGTPEDDRTKDGYAPNLGSIGVLPECGSNTLSPNGDPPPAPLIQSAHGGLNLGGYTRYFGTAFTGNLIALADWLLGRQESGGHWIADREEPPVDQGNAFATGAAVFTLMSAMDHADPVRRSAYRDAVDLAVTWTRGHASMTNQDRVFSLVTLLEGGVPPSDPDVQGLVVDLLSTQAPSGGWSERSGLQPNAYATGQALFALLESEVDVDHPAICAGMEWLAVNQLPSGAWSMGTSGVSTDSTRNSDFTATIWPVLALGSLQRFGVAFDPPSLVVETCRPEELLEVEIRNSADNPCGLFQHPDSLRVEAAGEPDTVVEVLNSPRDLNAGEAGFAEVSWSRPAGRLVEGETSIVELRGVSIGSEVNGCPREASAQVVLRGVADPVPGPTAKSLRLRREGPDLRLLWPAHPDPVGSYQILRLECPDRDPCPEDPSSDRMDALVPREEQGPGDLETLLAGEAVLGGPSLVFYKHRATSPCSLKPGPTCNYDCVDGTCHTQCN